MRLNKTQLAFLIIAVLVIASMVLSTVAPAFTR